MGGYNINILAHGQTGSGKTHTILGPKGLSKDGQIKPDLGLFPRAAVNIFNSLASTQVLTMSINVTLWGQMQCLLTKRMKMYVKDEFLGETEVLIKSTRDIFKLVEVIERDRCTNSTKMNDSSSKTHLCVNVNLYTKVDSGSARRNVFRFFDLMGSERLGKSGVQASGGELWSKAGNGDSSAMDHLMAVGANISLTDFSKAIESLSTLKKPLTGGEPIPISIVWKRGTSFVIDMV